MTKALLWLAKAVDTILDVGSFLFIGFLALNAYQGNIYTFGSMENSLRNAAYVVVFLVTTTWISNFYILSQDVFSSKLSWVTHFIQMSVAVIIDIGIAASFMFNLVFPAQFAILVIILHVVMNVFSGVMNSIGNNRHLFSKTAVSPAEEISHLREELVKTESQLTMAKTQLSLFDDNKQIQITDDNSQKIEAKCDICGWSSLYTNKTSAELGLSIHKGRAHKKTP